MVTQPRIGIVGAGKVGRTLARLLFARGYAVTAIYNRNTARAVELAAQVHGTAYSSVKETVERCDLVLLTVSDDAIQPIMTVMTGMRLDGKAVVHTSGVHEASLLQPLVHWGAMVGSLHPAYPFADVDSAMKGVVGSTFALQAQEALLARWLGEIVHVLDGRIIPLAEGQKALYHCAMVFVSNYSVTLYAIGLRLLETLGADHDAAVQGLNSLMSGMAQNISQHGVPDALTGPLVRGDSQTIGAHFLALGAVDVALQKLYLGLAEQTLPLLVTRGIDISTILTVLRRAKDDADNHS